MSFLKKNSSEILLPVVVLVFIILKLQTIATPYFWDELGVYVPGALMMKDNHTIGLLPSCLEPLYSRGHPLLFVFLQAIYFKIFGDNVVSGHSFSIILGCVTLLVFYWCSKDLFNKKTALLASVLLAVQPVFFAMAGVVLPEMMLTVFLIPAIWAIIRKRWLVCAVFSTLAMFTKEAAIIIPGVAFIVLLMDGIREKELLKGKRFLHLLLAGTPLILFAIFLFIQKKQNGWYLFPEHLGYIKPSELGDKSIKIFKDIFIAQGRFFTSIFLLIGLLKFRAERQNPIFLVVFIFVLLGVLSAGLNFYLMRYILFIIPFTILLSTHFGLLLIEQTNKKFQATLTLFFVVVSASLSVLFLNGNKFNDTADMSYLKVVNCEKEAINWVEKQPWSDSLVEANFPVIQGISEKRNGYLTGEPIPHSVNFEKKTKYGVLFHLNDDKIPVWNGSKFHVIKSFNQSFAHIDVVEFE